MLLRPAEAWARVLFCLLSALPLAAQSSAPLALRSEKLFFEAEWRLVRAGEVEMQTAGQSEAGLRLRTSGLVGNLFRVNNVYHAEYGPEWCVRSTRLLANEGRKHRETLVTFDADKKRAFYLEKDIPRDTVVSQQDIEIPPCICDLIGALQRLRQLRPAPGQTIEIPLSDGKKAILARVEAQTREKITTPAGSFNTIRYEADLFNGQFFRRKGRLYLWITEDDRRWPVQVRVQLPFYIGTVTLQLTKAETN
jgi:hypothetical protein